MYKYPGIVFSFPLVTLFSSTICIYKIQKLNIINHDKAEALQPANG